MTERPEILFACVHNAGRSQMAAALATLRSGGAVAVARPGSDPADRVDTAVVEAMAELGVDLGAETPKKLTGEAVREADVVVTMGCGDACPVYPASGTWTGTCRPRRAGPRDGARDPRRDRQTGAGAARRARGLGGHVVAGLGDRALTSASLTPVPRTETTFSSRSTSTRSTPGTFDTSAVIAEPQWAQWIPGTE